MWGISALECKDQQKGRRARATISVLAAPRESLVASDYHARAFGLDGRKTQTHHLSLARLAAKSFSK
jgi:hypothetical protein